MSDPSDTNEQNAFRVISYVDETSDSAKGHSGAGETVESDQPESGENEIQLSAIGTDSYPPVQSVADPSVGVGNHQPDVGLAGGETLQVCGKRVALVGRFGSMNQREAANVLLSFQCVVVDLPRLTNQPSPGQTDWSGLVDWVVIGAEQPPLSQSELLAQELIDAAARGELEIIHETELWERLGLFDVELAVRRYYTPAMLADLLDVSVRVIRRWHRRGLITPVTTLHKLPYFDYAEVATAKRLAAWIAAGASPAAIERRLVDLIQVLPGIRRPLDQLSILVEGKQILLRHGDGLVEPGGQMRFDFDALDVEFQPGVDSLESDDPSFDSGTIAFELPDQPPMLRAIGNEEPDPILAAAYQAEDEDDLETAIELYHTILARDGARADVSFQIGELLYRMNFLVAARERYYAAIEIDPDFVEARASLGAVLAELGQFELSVAALRGALSMYDDYADVHYTLAKTLDRIGDETEALEHWQRIIELAPESPWADEARERLGIDSSL